MESHCLSTLSVSYRDIFISNKWYEDLIRIEVFHSFIRAACAVLCCGSQNMRTCLTRADFTPNPPRKISFSLTLKWTKPKAGGGVVLKSISSGAWMRCQQRLLCRLHVTWLAKKQKTTRTKNSNSNKKLKRAPVHVPQSAQELNWLHKAGHFLSHCDGDVLPACCAFEMHECTDDCYFNALSQKDNLQFKSRFNSCRRGFPEERCQLSECAAVVQCLMLRKRGQNCIREIKSWRCAWILRTISNNHGLLSWNCVMELKWSDQWGKKKINWITWVFCFFVF